MKKQLLIVLLWCLACSVHGQVTTSVVSQAAACGAANIPCTNTVNTYTGTQAVSTGSSTTVGFVVNGTNGAGATPAYVQGVGGGAQSSTSMALTFTSNVTAGNAIILAINVATSSSAPTGVTDTLGNTYTLLQSTSSGGVHYAVYGSFGIVGGADTVTANGLSGGTYSAGSISEYYGLATTSPVDAQTSFVGTNASPQTVGPITTTQTDLIYSVYMIDCCAASGSMAASGYTSRTAFNVGGTGYSTATADKNVGAGTASISWTINTTGRPSVIALIALKAALTTPQVADLQQWKDPAGSILSKVDASGNARFPNLDNTKIGQTTPSVVTGTIINATTQTGNSVASINGPTLPTCASPTLGATGTNGSIIFSNAGAAICAAGSSYYYFINSALRMSPAIFGWTNGDPIFNFTDVGFRRMGTGSLKCDQAETATTGCDLALGTINLLTSTAGTCSSTIAGRFQYTQGNASTKDLVQVCAHDASNVYAWRTIY